MAVEHMALVFEADDLTSAETLLLLAYANFTDAQGTCWPGKKRLVAMTKLSPSTVRRAREGLEEKNLLLHRRRTNKYGQSKTNIYRLNLPKLASMRRKDEAFDDDLMGMEFTTEPTLEKASDQPRGHHDTPPEVGGSTMAPPGFHGETPGGATMNPPPFHGGTQSVIDPSVDPSSDPTRERTLGRTEEISEPETTPDLAEIAEGIVDGADLGRVGPGRTQRKQITNAVAVALAKGYQPLEVEAYLRLKLAEAHTVKYLLGAFAPERLPEIHDAPATPPPPAPLPPVCGQCDARPGDPVSARIVWDDADRATSTPCPLCHPRAHPRAHPQAAATRFPRFSGDS